VRIGLYLQWASTFILRNLGSWDRISQARTVTNALCGAIALAAAINVLDGSALAIDYLLSYYLTIVLFYSESYNLVRQWGEDADEEASAFLSAVVYRLCADWALIFQNVLFTSYTLFGVWFWQKGYQSARRTSCAERAAIFFLFDFRASEWRTAATSLACIIGVILFIILLLHLRSLKKGVLSGPELVFFRTFNTLSGYPTELILMSLLRPIFPLYKKEENFATAPGRFKITGAFIFGLFHYFLIHLAGPTVAVISVERIISANHLTTPGITQGTGQMISLLTGATSFCSALWQLGMKLRETNASSTSIGMRERLHEHGGERSLFRIY
jgi:hypothetical protein